MSKPAPATYAQAAYVQARSFEYADNDSFARIAATFGARTAFKTYAVALGVFQTAFYAVLSAATYPVSFINRRGYDLFSSRMNTSAKVVADVARSAVWGDPKSSRPNPTKPLVLTRVQKLKASAMGVLTAARTRVTNTASGASALAGKARQKVSSFASGTKAFASAHRKEILIATVAVATAAAAVAAYHFEVFGQEVASGSTSGTASGSTSGTAASNAFSTPSVVADTGNGTLSNATVIQMGNASSTTATPPAAQAEEGWSTEAKVAVGVFTAAAVGTGAMVGGSVGGPIGAAVGAVAGPPVMAVASLLGTLADQN